MNAQPKHTTILKTLLALGVLAMASLIGRSLTQGSALPDFSFLMPGVVAAQVAAPAVSSEGNELSGRPITGSRPQLSELAQQPTKTIRSRANEAEFPLDDATITREYRTLTPDPHNPGQFRVQLRTELVRDAATEEQDESNREIQSLVRKLRSAEADSRDEKEVAALREALEKQFQSRHNAQVQRLEKVLADAQRSQEILEQRSQQRDEIIARRLAELLGQADTMSWEYSLPVPQGGVNPTRPSTWNSREELPPNPGFGSNHTAHPNSMPGIAIPGAPVIAPVSPMPPTPPAVPRKPQFSQPAPEDAATGSSKANRANSFKWPGSNNMADVARELAEVRQRAQQAAALAQEHASLAQEHVNKLRDKVETRIEVRRGSDGQDNVTIEQSDSVGADNMGALGIRLRGLAEQMKLAESKFSTGLMPRSELAKLKSELAAAQALWEHQLRVLERELRLKELALDDSRLEEQIVASELAAATERWSKGERNAPSPEQLQAKRQQARNAISRAQLELEAIIQELKLAQAAREPMAATDEKTSANKRSAENSKSSSTETVISDASVTSDPTQPPSPPGPPAKPNNKDKQSKDNVKSQDGEKLE